MSAFGHTSQAPAPHTMPKLDVPYLDAFNIIHGPPGVLGRFNLIMTQQLARKGLSVSFADFDEIAAVHVENIDSWSMLNPMFDSRVSKIKSNGFCVVGRDRAGHVVATCSGKLIDAKRQSYGSMIADGGFYDYRPDVQDRLTARMTTRGVDDMYGRLGYSGSLWIHPDYRHLRLPAIFCRLVTATMLTLWNPDLILGSVAADLRDTGYAERYGYKSATPMLEVSKDGHKLAEYVLLWMSAAETAEDLAHFLDVLWPQIDRAVVSGRGHHTA
jgi:hypothetical protein